MGQSWERVIDFPQRFFITWGRFLVPMPREESYDIAGLWKSQSESEYFYDANEELLVEEEPKVVEGFLEEIPVEIMLSSIWPRIIGGAVAHRVRKMIMLKMVCKGWYNWIENNEDYQEDLREYYEAGDFRRGDNVENVFGRERDPADWSSDDWIDECLSDRS
jgi:hypothetical protein